MLTTMDEAIYPSLHSLIKSRKAVKISQGTLSLASSHG